MATADSSDAPKPAITEPMRLLSPELHRWKGRLLLIAIVGLASALAETASIGLVLLLLAILFGDGAQSPLIANSPLAFADAWLPSGLHPGWAALGLFAAIVLRLALTAWHGCLSAAFSVRTGHETRSRLFQSIVDMPLEVAQRQSWGELHTLVNEHSNAVPRALDAVCDIVHALTVLAIVGLLLLVIAPVEAAIGIISVLALNRAMARLRRPVEAAGEDYATAAKAMSEGLIRTLHALRTFQILGLASRQHRRFVAASGRAAQAQMRAVTLALIANPASHVSALAAVTVMALSSSVLGSSSGTLLVAVGLLYRLEPYAAKLQSAQIRLTEQCPALRRLASVGPPASHAGSREPPGIVGTIRLRDISFTYGSRDGPVLERLDLAIPAGGWTLIEGPSGAGKSTLVNLLLGLIQPKSGQITVGDAPLDTFDQAAWRRAVAVCGQDIELIGGTLRDNLMLGARAPSADALAEAVEAACLAPLIAELPDGLHTELGERGVQLSGGQRQRLAIAAALLRRPQVLILDEATSMLDKASQTQILANLSRLMRGRTVIVIGHGLPDLPPITARLSLGLSGARQSEAPRATYG